jgi:hypothetical protein
MQTSGLAALASGSGDCLPVYRTVVAGQNNPSRVHSGGKAIPGF